MKEVMIGSVGSGGDGLVLLGDLIIAAAAKSHYYGILSKSFGSQIRGGESSIRLRLAEKQISSSGDALNFLVGLNPMEYVKFNQELPITKDTYLLYESTFEELPEALTSVIPKEKCIAIPFSELSREVTRSPLAKNIIALAILIDILGLSKEIIENIINSKFAKKGSEVADNNLKALQRGYAYAQELNITFKHKFDPQTGGQKMMIDGNTAIAAAAVYAGLEFYAGYPISPSSELFQYMTRELPKTNGRVLQAEDEIASITSIIGASFAGRKSMTATSGPGLALMTEAIGLATVSELPLVVVDVQRGGPSTGVPTKVEQADLYQALFSAHGDGMRPVIAPYNMRSAITTTIEAFNIAESYQSPVIVLSDQYLGQRKDVIDAIELGKVAISSRKLPTEEDLKEYKRYRMTDDLISPIAPVGMEGGTYLASGIEHDELGWPSAKHVTHEKMNRKRIHKFEPLRGREDLVRTYGAADAKTAVIAWGSTGGVAVEPILSLNEDGKKVKLILPVLLCPLPVGILQKHLERVEKLLVVELSFLQQFKKYLRMELDLPRQTYSLSRSGGMIMSPSEIIAKLEEIGL